MVRARGKGEIIGNGDYTATFNKPFIDTNYNIVASPQTQAGHNMVNDCLWIRSIGTNYAIFDFYDGGDVNDCYWQASGYTTVPDITDYTEPLRMHFKVANAVQNLELLDAGEVLSAVSDIASTVQNIVHITETYSNGTSGYNVYSNGYCEQWGEFTSSDMTVTFLKPFIDTNYNINVGNYDYTSPDDGNYTNVQWRDKTTSTVRFQASYGGVLYATTVDWCARGYISI